MEPETEKKMTGRTKLLISISVFLVLFIIYYSVMMMMSPVRKYTEMRKDSGIDSTEVSRKGNPVYSDSTFLKLVKEKAFLQTRIVMAGTDSIYLTMNLGDSTAHLEISGVSVHKVKFPRMEASKILIKGDENIILWKLSTPFEIARDWSTIKKEPVMIKMAPRDTSEYKPDIMPDTSLTEPVYYILEMTDGTRLYVSQLENDKPQDRRSRFIFDLRYRMSDAWNSIKSVIRFRIPEYRLFIKIYLPRSDAKIIYRAIPKNGQIAIYL